MATQALLAARWAKKGLFPFATDCGPFRAGRDILGTPGWFVEVKAKTDLSLNAIVEKAKREAAEGEVAVLVWRHNGQGLANMDKWTVTMQLCDFEKLVRARQRLQDRLNEDYLLGKEREEA